MSREILEQLARTELPYDRHPTGLDPSNKREYFRQYYRKRRQTALGKSEIARTNLKARRGITLEQYKALHDAQCGKCAICDSKIVPAYNPNGGTGRKGSRTNLAHVDHDHTCCPGDTSCPKCIRGLLCGKCNTGLACFLDSPHLLQAAVAYLKQLPHRVKSHLGRSVSKY